MGAMVARAALAPRNRDLLSKKAPRESGAFFVMCNLQRAPYALRAGMPLAVVSEIGAGRRVIRPEALLAIGNFVTSTVGRSGDVTPAIAGAFVLTTRGGDFDLHIGQDVSIGYLSHTDSIVRLYLQETLTFLLLTTEAAVALAPTDKTI